jgi:DNA-binding PucR family transcriptional regulator
MLLAGDIADEAELEYLLDAWHVALVVSGTPAESLRRLATSLDRRLLLVPSPERAAWAWLGGRREFTAEDHESIVAFTWPRGAFVAVGEAARGRSGWCLSHQQAIAAHSVVLRSAADSPRPRRYGEVALLATALQDETLRRSLHHLYLEPLRSDRDDGVALRQALRAYFATQGNITSMSAALGVDRKTTAKRLRLAEEKIGRSLTSCAADLELALRLEELATR